MEAFAYMTDIFCSILFEVMSVLIVVMHAGTVLEILRQQNRSFLNYFAGMHMYFKTLKCLK